MIRYLIQYLIYLYIFPIFLNKNKIGSIIHVINNKTQINAIKKSCIICF